MMGMMGGMMGGDPNSPLGKMVRRSWRCSNPHRALFATLNCLRHCAWLLLAAGTTRPRPYSNYRNGQYELRLPHPRV